MKKIWQYADKIFPLLVFLLFGYYLLGANFTAKLGIIDDHEVSWFMGEKGKVEITDIPQVLSRTELGQFGEYKRFRPSYYLLRVIETVAWGNNAGAWYFARYLLFVASMY